MSFRQMTEQDHVRKLITALLAAGYSITVTNGGDSDEITCSIDQAEIEKVMFATDDETVYCHKDGDISAIYLVYGNAPDEVVNDHSVSLTPILDAVHAECFPDE